MLLLQIGKLGRMIYLKINIRSFLTKFIASLILIMPIIRYYNFWGTNIGLEAVLKSFVLILLILLLLMRNRRIFYDPSIQKSGTYFFLFALYATIVTCIYQSYSLYYESRSVNFTIAFIVSLLVIFLLLYAKIDYSCIFKVYSFFVWLMVAICIFQWILLINGVRVPFNLPGFNYTSSWEQLTSQIFGMNEYPTALFSEKAHFCEYLIPYVAFCLFSEEFVKNYRILKAVIISLLTIMSTSGNGVVLAFLCWGLYFTFFNEFDFRNRMLLFIIGVMVIGISFYALTQIDTINTVLSMLFTNNTYGYSKANYRVYRGFDIYSLLPTTQKLFGVGYYNMETFASINNIVSQYDTQWNIYEYFSAFTQILIYFGALGFIFIVGHIIPLFKNQSNLTKGLVILLIAISLSSEILLQGFHMMFLILILSSIQNNSLNRRYDDANRLV